MNTTNTTIAYADFFNSKEWQTFGTFTTRYPLSMKSARRAMERLHENLTTNYGKTELLWVAEPFDTKYGYHTHALVKLNNCPDKNINPLLRNSWQIVSGGKGGKANHFTVLKEYDRELGGNYYISKYMLKTNVDWDIFI